MTRPAEEWLREEPIRLLREYVRIDTTPARGELEGAEFWKRFFECEGIAAEVVCPAPRHCNVLARLPGREPGGALLLLNHIDVVEAFPDNWEEAKPFEGTIKNGYLYGRGAYDMKSLALAQALAMASLKRRGIVPRHDILFLAEADEEIEQRWGSRWLLDHRPDWFSGVAWVLNEGGTNEMILRNVRFWGVETIQAGYASLELESAAQEPLRDIAVRWPRLSFAPVAAHPHARVGFGMLANHLSSPLTDPLRHLDRVRANPAELAVLPDRYGAFLEARIAWSQPYPAPYDKGKVRRYVTISAPPGVPLAPLIDPIEADARRAGLAVVGLHVSEPTVASPFPSPLTSLLERVTEARYPGTPFGPVPTFGGYTTSTLFRERGFATYGYSPIAVNLADAAMRHWNDERIFLRDYLNGVAFFRDAIEEFAIFGAN